MTGAVELYHDLVADACARRVRRCERVLEIGDGGAPVRVASTGFYPSRWVRFCDDYLGAGPSYDAWLLSPVGEYLFANGAGHRRGGCLTSASVDDRALRVRSRACLLVPTGVLDLKLIQMTLRRLGLRRAVWRIDDLHVDPLTLFSYERYAELPHASDAARSADEFLARVVDADLGKHVPGVLGRHKKAVRRARQPLTCDETYVERAFTYVTPADLATDDLSEARVRALTGPRGPGEWQYSTDAELSSLGLSAPVDFAGLATRRLAARFVSGCRWGTEGPRGRAKEAVRVAARDVAVEVARHASRCREHCRRAERSTSLDDAVPHLARAWECADAALALAAQNPRR